MEHKYAIVTGAYGLVGKYLCDRLTNLGYEACKIKFDELLPITDVDSNDFFAGRKMAKADVIIHAAGYGQPQMFSKDKIKTIYINTTFTERLFEYLKPNGRFLFVSSSEVYSGAPSPHKETDIGTTTPQHPRACYIEGKRCGEAICMAYKEQGYDVKIARLALAYGPGTKKGDTRVLNQFIEQALITKEIRMKDDGSALRTYCYIDDAVDMILNVLFKGKETVYNIGGQSTLSILELAQRISGITAQPYSIGKKIDIGAPDDVKVCLNRYLSEFPREFVSINDGLKRTIEYQKQLYGIN